MTSGAYDPDLLRSQLVEKSPDADSTTATRLSEIWCQALDRVFDATQQAAMEHFASLPIEIRENAIFEWAKLSYWFAGVLIEEKLKGRHLSDISPGAEEELLESAEEREKLEATGRNIALGAWIPILDGLVAPHRRVLPPGAETSRRARAPELPAVRWNHFTPVFTQRYWATGAEHRVFVYSLGIDGRVVSRETGYKSWGAEPYLYSANLERWLGLIETDAAGPYSELLNLVPLDEAKRRRWVAFLASQVFRTPTAALRLVSALREIIERNTGEPWTDVASLRRGYEMLFRNNNVFTAFYRRLVPRRWTILTATGDAEFVRGDVPAIVESRDGDWSLVYAMTPKKCFVAGPDANPEPSRVIPYHQDAPEAVVDAVNVMCARRARESVISTTSADSTAICNLLEGELACERTEVAPAELFGEFWGDLG